MTEEEAQAWVRARYDVAVVERLNAFAAMVVEENQRQNLISPATIASLWSRHIADSLQLSSLADQSGRWLDIGSGGGFPGLPVAIAGVGSMLLVEPRRRRGEFLASCISKLALANVAVVIDKVERIEAQADVISARAVTSVEKLLHAAVHCATPVTRWLLPRGSADLSDVIATLSVKKMVFHVEQSVTEPASSILVIEGVPR